MNAVTYVHPRQLLQKTQSRCLRQIYYGNDLIFDKESHLN